MKTSSILASALFGAIAIAAPVEKRALVTKTQIVTTTVIVYTTVWDNQPVAPATPTVATSEPGLFYEHSKKPSSAAPLPTSVYTPPVVQEPSSVYTPPPPPPPSSSAVPEPEPSSVYTPPPAPSSVYTPPAPSSVDVPAPVSSSPPPAQTSTPSGGDGTPNGQVYHGDLTVYDTYGGFGACGHQLSDDDMTVAIDQSIFGETTHDVMTGEATNFFCGKTITIDYNGVKVNARVEDRCTGCNGGVDATRAVWAALGLADGDRLKCDWYLSS